MTVALPEPGRHPDTQRGTRVNKYAMKRLSLPIIPALLVGGTSLNPAQALELGEIEIQSSLGQPLRASIAYALGPNEAIAEYCISLAPGNQLSGMPNLGQANIRVSNGVITLTGSTPVREPLMTARLSIQCPYTPKVAREYTFFVDPSELPTETRYAEATAPATRKPVAALPVQASTPQQAVRREREPVVVGSTYRVQPGDSLSDIASRLEDRQVGLWQAVNAIFVANPDAFLNDDPNQLKAGSLLDIPAATALGQVAPMFTAASEPASTSAASEPVTTVDDTAYLEPAPSTVYEPVVERVEDPAPAPVITETDVPQVGDITIDAPAAEAPVAEPLETPVAEAEPNAESLVVPVVPEPEVIVETAAPAALATQPSTSTGSSYVVWWTLGGALALIGGIFAWRRRGTGDDNFLPEVAARAPHPMRRATDENSIEVRVIENPEEAAGIDFDLSDDSPTEENLALDADLFEGSGLSEVEPTDRADFGFAETTDLDLEIPEAATREPNEPGTDVIPPLRRDAGSILESEVLPEEHDYDMSVILDATKTPQPEEATERDLKAVLVDAGEKTIEEEAYTLSQEVDYEILEQDYEDEMTATQALNMEIEKAAREIAADMDEDAVTVESERLSTDDTTALPIANVAELDVTASMLAGNDDEISDLDDTNVNEALTLEAGEDTAELEQRRADDADFDDITEEMEIRTGKSAG